MKKRMESTNDNASMERSVNTFVLVVITVIDLLMFAGYIGDYLKKNIGIKFLTAVLLAVLCSMLANYIIYFRKRDSGIFRQVSLIGYIIVYALCVFGSRNDLVFCIAFPITVIYILYFDFKLILGGAIAFGVINVADLVYVTVVQGHLHSGAPINSTTLLLQGACVTVYLLVICNSTRISNGNHALQLAHVIEGRERSNALLQDILKVASAVRRNSQEASDYIRELGRDVEMTTEAMGEIAQGNNNNALNIERQTVMTGNIQSMIEETRQMSGEMLKQSGQSAQAVQEGRESIRNLAGNSRKTQEANRQVEASVRNFIQNVNEVQEIVAQIFSISDQTDLLALNASIESARAGEAGRGFSVVAEEIRKLAEETRVLTEKIEEIVVVLQNNADQAVETVDHVLETSSAGHILIDNTYSRFNEIDSSMEGLSKNVQQICQKIEEVMESNNAIVDSISQISAVSEEVAASTQQTAEKSMETREKAEHAERLMTGLMETVSSIDKYLEE